MSKVTRIAPNPNTPTIRIELTEQEAQRLVAILGPLIGPPEMSLYNVYSNLIDLGVV